jgi:stringent starvation protein B
MKSPLPYIINAHIQCIDDSGEQPHITLRNSPKTKFPRSLQSEEFVTFNISSGSVTKLVIDEFGISFNARFGGVECDILAPLECLVEIRSKDGTVRIPVTVPEAPVDVYIQPKVPVKLIELTLVIGDGLGDGVPTGKLSLVKT